MGNETSSGLYSDLEDDNNLDDIRKSKMCVRRMRQHLHTVASKEECVPFSLINEKQLRFLLRVFESAEGRAKMRVLLRGIIEEREVAVNSIEEVAYEQAEGEDEYEVRSSYPNAASSYIIKTETSNEDLAECLSLQFPNLYKERRQRQRKLSPSKRLPLVNKKEKKKLDNVLKSPKRKSSLKKKRRNLLSRKKKRRRRRRKRKRRKKA